MSFIPVRNYFAENGTVAMLDSAEDGESDAVDPIDFAVK